MSLPVLLPSLNLHKQKHESSMYVWVTWLIISLCIFSCISSLKQIYIVRHDPHDVYTHVKLKPPKISTCKCVIEVQCAGAKILNPDISLTSDWLLGSGSCGPFAPPPPAWIAPPPAAVASLQSAAACWPGWSPAGGPPSRAGAAWSPGPGPPRPAPTSSHCPAVLAGAVYSAPWEDKKGNVITLILLTALSLSSDHILHNITHHFQHIHNVLFFHCHKGVITR